MIAVFKLLAFVTALSLLLPQLRRAIEEDPAPVKEIAPT